MPGFTSRDDIINEVTSNGKVDLWNFYKIASSASQGAAGVWQSLWKGVGNPGAGSDPGGTPGTAYVTDAGTSVAGAMWFPDRSTDQRYLLSFGAVANQDCTLMLYDRLAGVGAISTTTTGAKTVNSSALDRYSGTAAILNEVWLEVTTATTVTAPVVNLNSYTSADGSNAQSGGSVTFPAAATVLTAMVQVPLSATKQGVRSVEAGLNIGTASTAGAVNVLIIRPLARIPLRSGQWNEVSFLDDVMGLPRIFDNATLGLAICAPSGVTTTVWGTVSCAYG
jgi:hypothetical protein